ncbi:MAG: transcriptional regulator MraZ [Betaproteobacteria bacterium]|nr:transcriptional regulator MraZ [Betaproteobacteria bacterium]
MYIKGSCEASLDDKGRLAIPKRYRDQLLADPELVLTAGPDGCLLLYPVEHWQAVSGRLQQLSAFNEQARWWQRMIIGHAEDHKLDKSDRILVSQSLREQARITKDVKMMGQGNRIEIWDAEQWRATEATQRSGALNSPPPGGESFTL